MGTRISSFTVSALDSTMKYEEEMREFRPCPPLGVKEESRVLFRWVHFDEPEKSFLPVAVLNPARVQIGRNCCSLFALSFFTTEAAARARYRQLTAKRSKLRLQLGDHLATVDVKEVHGVQTQGEGHRDLFEYSGCALSWTSASLL